jgi:hypothetical protein
LNPIIEVVERHGLVTTELAAASLERLSLQEIISVSDELTEAISQESIALAESPAPLAEPFAFLASASARADAGCGSVTCRTRTLSALARYAALYCDHVAVPFNIHIVPEVGVLRAREALLRSVTLIELRPVIEAGIVRLFVPKFCRHCMQRLPSAAAVTDLARRFATERFDQFTASYVRGRSTQGLKLEGPSEFMYHGALTRRLDKIPGWLPVSSLNRAKQGSPVKLSGRTLKKSGIVDSLFETIALDVIHQQLEVLIHR